MQYKDYNSLLIDSSYSIGYISDIETYELLHLTQAALDIYGMKDREDYRGKTCYQLLQNLEEPCPFCVNSLLREGRDYRWEHYNDHLGRWYDNTDSLINIGGRLCHMQISRDITGRKEESVSTDQFTTEDVLFHCLKILTTQKDMQTSIRMFLEAIGGYYQADRTYLFEIDRETNILSNTFEWCAADTLPLKDTLESLPLENIRVWLDRFESEDAFFVSSLEEALDQNSVLYHDLRSQGINSLLMASLVDEGTVVGLLGVNNPCQQQGDLLLLRSVSEFAQTELERRHLITELEHMSYTDPLTNLKNRNLYNRILKEYDRSTPHSLGVIFVDINGMKSINDRHGYTFGDHVIKEVAAVLTKTLTGSVFRIGGDEFVILSENIPKDDFLREMVDLRKAFEKESAYDVSIGCAWQAGEDNTMRLLQQADELMLAEKQSYYRTLLKKGHNAFYSGFSGEVAKEIEDGLFVVYYQPQVDLKTQKIVGAEALVRKMGENGDLISPGKFIPIYEVQGVISHIDLFVMRTVCAAIHKWRMKGYDLHFSVNFSRMTLLTPDIITTIKDICTQHEVPPSSITVEVTESISQIDNDYLSALLKELNQAGFTISLDDFGSHYSNLAILASMDFDEIKFDKTLVDSLEHNQKSQIVLANTIRMCRDLKETTSLAEGIETRGQLELLINYQCDYGQGYYFSKPISEEAFDLLLKKQVLS